MDTGITASVATFRVFSSNQGSNSRAGYGQIDPPNSKDRMAATPVTEGPLLLSKLASNEVTYLQVNDFTRAIMTRSRIWRVSSHELVIPATFSTYWLVTLHGTQRAIAKLEKTLSALCKYEVSSDEPIMSSQGDSEEEDDLLFDDNDDGRNSEFGSLSPRRTHNEHVLNARQTISRGKMSQMLNGSETPWSASQSTPNTKQQDRQVSKGSIHERYINALHEDSTPELDPPRRTHTKKEESINNEPIIDHAPQHHHNPTHHNSNNTTTELSNLGLDPLGDTDLSVMSSPPLTPSSNNGEIDTFPAISETELHSLGVPSSPHHPSKDTYNIPSEIIPAVRQSSPIYVKTEFTKEVPSPSVVTYTTKTTYIDSQQRIDNHNELDDLTSETKSVSEHSDTPTERYSESVSDTDEAEMYWFGVGNKHEQQPNDTVIKEKFAPRFSHPLIPTSHISKFYPRPAANSSDQIRPITSLPKRELTVLGPGNLHQDITTVGGYIGFRAIKGLMRKT